MIGRAVPIATDSTIRATSSPASTGRGYIWSRPVSIRATSSSSAISRASRSLSAETVSSISFFWSSLSLSHRFSSAVTKPFTPVSGERSSWATVATRSERSRSSRARPRPDRSVIATRSTGCASEGRCSLAETSTSVPSGSSQVCSGTAVRVARPSYGELRPTQPLPSWSVSARTNSSGWPTGLPSTPSIRTASAEISSTRPRPSAMTTPSGSASTICCASIGHLVTLAYR